MLFALLVVGALFTACDNTNEGEAKVVITSESEIKVGKYATDVTIHYDILGITDVMAEVSLSEEGWLRVTRHESGSVVISVLENETEGARMAAVTLTYGASKASAVISQSADALAPVITSLSGEEMTLERMGKRVEIAYTLENENPVDYVYAKTNADWIYSIDTNRKGIITLGVGTNTTKAMRETEVTVGYGTASFKILLKQRGDGDIRFSAPMLSGEYLGDAYTPGVGNYWFILSDRGFKEDGSARQSATYYRIDAYGAVYNGNADMVPIAPGTYTYDPENTYAVGTFTAEYSGHWVTNTDGKREGAIKTFESGTMVVESGKITLDVVIEGETHHVEYVGNTGLTDSQGEVTIYTTLDGDYEADLSDHTLVYECYGDYYECGFTNWMIVIKPNNGTSGDCFQFDFITDKATKAEGFCGDYVSSDFIATNSFIPGWTDGVNLLCSWYFNAEQTEFAPFRGGEMSIKDNGDGTITVDIKVKDDLRNTITGTWTGVPQPFSSNN
jgi:hypothetical protein